MAERLLPYMKSGNVMYIYMDKEWEADEFGYGDKKLFRIANNAQRIMFQISLMVSPRRNKSARMNVLKKTNSQQYMLGLIDVIIEMVFYNMLVLNIYFFDVIECPNIFLILSQDLFCIIVETGYTRVG
eukprot:TRINITY_DN69905_c0_g1_i2.p4 TRINITY_DN69905_c0_g1~~TRINITY_DN69905_c0_g1_i2.p4  ORF type:complete len:128 (-),score=2.53 TRINITY_DN69905_c0_g1_i2:382-765(-)